MTQDSPAADDLAELLAALNDDRTLAELVPDDLGTALFAETNADPKSGGGWTHVRAD